MKFDPSNEMPEEDGHDDEYALESVDVGLADYVTPLFVGDFERNWKEAGKAVETYSYGCAFYQEYVSVFRVEDLSRCAEWKSFEEEGLMGCCAG
jgi:hypothetical protein